EENRLTFGDREVSRRGERLDPGTGPHERERERELDLAQPAGALSVDEALPHRGRLSLGHSRLELLADMFHRRRRNLVREAQALELLLGLERACADEQGRRVGRLRERI